MGERLHFYEGSKDHYDRFYSKTQIEVANLDSGHTVSNRGDVMAYLSKGSGAANGEKISARTLMRNDGIEFRAHEAA